jgi:hypothetical protein
LDHPWINSGSNLDHWWIKKGAALTGKTPLSGAACRGALTASSSMALTGHQGRLLVLLDRQARQVRPLAGAGLVGPVLVPGADRQVLGCWLYVRQVLCRGSG